MSVVTGASAGVGRAIAVEFARRGWVVGLIARGRAGLDGARPSARETAPGQEITPSMSAGLRPASPIASSAASSVKAITPFSTRRPTSDWPMPEMMQASSNLFMTRGGRRG